MPPSTFDRRALKFTCGLIASIALTAAAFAQGFPTRPITVVVPSVQARLPYRGIRDFAPVSDVLTIGFILVTWPDVPAGTLKKFMALPKADPSKYSYG